MAFAPTEDPDDHFTIDKIDTGIPPAVVAQVKKGLLFGMANWDAFMPGFSLTAATSKRAGGTPFYASILTTPSPSFGFRPSVETCGGAMIEPETVEDLVADVEGVNGCIPRVVLRHPSLRAAETFTTDVFIHELSHVAQDYWEQSTPYLNAGGMKLASAYHQGFAWQIEGDAQFTERHGPSFPSGFHRSSR